MHPSFSKKAPEKEKVCAVICNWNKVQELIACVESVLKSNFSNFDLVVVDNGSNPECLLEIKNQLHSSVILLENEKNEGGAAGFNRGMKYALDQGIYDSIWLLDNDVVVDPSCLTELVTELRKSEDNAIVGAMILRMDFPDLLTEFGAYFDRKEFALHHHLKDFSLSKVDTAVISVDFVPACCLIVDIAKLKKVGLMDDAYFLYCDDIDWCLQFKRAGYEIKATPLAKVWHKGGGANKKNGVPRYYAWRNKTHLFLHHMNPNKDVERFIDGFLISQVLSALFITLKIGKIHAFNTLLNAVIDAFSKVRGRIHEDRILPLDPYKYGSDFNDSIKEMIVISDPRVPDDFIQPFFKTQPSLSLPVPYYGEHLDQEKFKELIESHCSQGESSKAILVLCGHILTKPNQYEGVLHSFLLENDASVYFIDSFENLVRGFNKMRKIREDYQSLLKTVNTFRNELKELVKQKHIQFFVPLVSVVIPTFNQAEFLVEAISSAQHQTYPNIEIVVVNDGSQDNTAEILKKMAAQDPRIRYFNQANQGFAVATNKAIQESKGEYVVHLDSDDTYEPDKIEKQMEILQHDKSIDLVHTAIQVIDKEGIPLMQMRGSDVDPDTFLAQMLFRSIMPNPTTIMGKRACFLHVPYREKYKRSVDYDRVLRLAEKYRFKYLDLPLTRWRRHDRNLTNELQKYKEEQFDILQGYNTEDLMRYVDKATLSPPEKMLLKGNIFYNLEKWAEALDKFKEVESATGYFYCGNCLFKMKKTKEAIASYRRCLQQDPSHATCWNNLGVTLGDSTEADDCFHKALRIRSDYLDPQYNLSHHDKRFTDRELRQELIPYILT